VGAGLLIETFRNLDSMNPGFAADHVLIVSADLSNAKYSQERLASAYAELLDRVRAIPGVRSATVAGNTPISGSGWNDELAVDGFAPKDADDTLAWFYSGFPRLFETLGMQFVAGRDFDDRDRAGSTQVAVVNETMAKRFFGSANPIGKSYRTRGANNQLSAPVEVIGVVKDAKYRSLREANLPIVYVPILQQEHFFPFLTLELRAQASAADLIPSAKSVLEQYDRRMVISFKTLSAQVAESLNRERLLATLSGFFGILALLLAAIGLYGVMSYNVARRRGEIGIRMALGAEQSRVLRLILREVTLVVIAGLIAGSIVAVASTQLVATFLYGLKPRDPMTIALAAVVLAAVAALAGYLPARRASRLDPMIALREE